MKFLELHSGAERLRVSRLALGTAGSVARLPEAEIFQLLDLFTEAGGNCIDTARSYEDGRSEVIIGEWMQARGNRDQLVISTKGCHPLLDEVQKPRLSLQDLEHDLQLSLEALRTDRIDIYWIHKDDPQHPVEDIIESVNHVMRSGTIKMIGCSNWHVERIQKANAYARKSGLAGFTLSQIQWSLAHSYEEYFKQYQSVLMSDAEYAWYLENKMPVFAYSPQAQGFFARAAAQGLEAVSERGRRYYGSEDNLKRLEKVKEYAQQHNVPVSVAVLGYITCNRLPGVAVFGARNPAQLLETLQAADLNISPEEADRLYHVGKERT
jgi:aryl-alcohol dehydrogenase-like predicted oxidoreductase